MTPMANLPMIPANKPIVAPNPAFRRLFQFTVAEQFKERRADKRAEDDSRQTEE